MQLWPSVRQRRIRLWRQFMRPTSPMPVYSESRPSTLQWLYGHSGRKTALKSGDFDSSETP